MADQLIRKPQRQIGERADIDHDHIELIGAIALDSPAEHAEARIVDDVFNVGPHCSECLGDLVASVWLREVAGNDDRRGAARGHDFVRQGGQAIGAARHQGHAVTVRCKNARQLGAYARRCTGYQRHTLSHDGNS